METKEKDIKFVFHGRPTVQKNNLNIRYKYIGKRKVPFIGHSKEMSAIRDAMAIEFYKQYKEQGYCDPINYTFEAHMVFYVPRKSEPDLDNLPAIVLDALQGVKVKKTKTKVAITLTDDKLLRKESSRKIVEGDTDYDGDPRTEITIRRYPADRSCQVPDGDRAVVATPQGGRKRSSKRPKSKV